MKISLRWLAVGLLLSALVCTAEASASKYRWRKPVINVAVSTSLSSNVSNIAAGTDVNAVIERSIASWQKAANVSFSKSLSTDQNVTAAGPQGDGVSLLTIAATPENLAMFPQGLQDATARTRVFYDARGFITEADIVLNPYLQFSADGTVGTFDLEATLTHEIGHLLGLSHSPVLGATMSEGHGRNGIFGLPAFGARTLSSDDIAVIRSLYGPADKDENCCGRVSGKLISTAGKPAANYTVWAEDSENANVVAATVTQADGTFKLGGLPFGGVELFAQNDPNDQQLLAAVSLGPVTVSAKPATLSRKLDQSPLGLRPEYLGFNGQLADLSLLVNSGNAYNIWIGGPDLQQKGTDVGTDSDRITIEPGVSLGSFGNGITTLGFYANVSADTPNGDYSVFVKTSSGARRYLVGGLSVEKFPNLWSTSNFK